MSVIAIFVALVAVVAVVAELAEPLILTANEVIDPLAEFNGTAVVPIKSEELPKTPLGIVPDKLPAVRKYASRRVVLELSRACIFC